MQLPLDLTWDIEPSSWHVDAGIVTVTTGPATDYFIDPAGGHRALNAPRAVVASPPESWQLKARVTVDFSGTYDAGVLMVYADDEHWAKLCFERSPQGSAMVVSVVTNGVSDDANAWVVPDPAQIWLRISRVRQAYAFHASPDGKQWEFVRYFRLDTNATVRAGIEVQAPIGDGCTATFSELSMTSTELLDLRDGS
ncbi:hypothetical protein Rhe02_46100 [Rhizocola hellebori]|uniref:DUF1349 domain-containing protein n=1 Tax=Rhizocola hellebori TaxID=1392758 RepID=A0A8J3Q9C2_9ACTN|nr:DUF1349 domain-containing protein [Rhizocola hellebori]GIH06543.1 hypothetical protein Rhe02_46100 [Rhizocola hellebori]